MKSSGEKEGEERRGAMEGGGGDLIDWEMEAEGTPAGKNQINWMEREKEEGFLHEIGL